MKGKSANKNTNIKVMGKEEEFIRLSHILRGELNNANWHFVTWKCLWNYIESYSDEMNVAHTFFTLSMRGNLLETLLRLNKLFDKGEDSTTNISYFLDFAEKNMGIFAVPAADRRKRYEEDMILEKQAEEEKPSQVTRDVIKEHRAKLKELPVRKLKKWEDDALLHIDGKVAKTHINVFDECPVDIEEIDRTIDTIHEILNVYSVAYDGQRWDKDLVFTHGIKNMLDAIKSGRKQNPK
ncbi:MAG: hypothetical protein WC455_03225 [Dehalococcoidia bacterium]|jgi:hypothetical protein